MNLKNRLVSKTAKIIYLAILLLLNGVFFRQLTLDGALVWYVIIALNLAFIIATGRWIKRTDS